MSSSVDIQAAQAWCADFVAQRPSNVTRLAGLLPAAKRPLFYPAYCAMRVIDDEVDDVFLALADSRRDAERPGVARRVEQWRNDAVESLAVSMGGSFSAEHGVGRLRLRQMSLYKSDVERDLMTSIKQTLDPAGLLNPGKVVAFGHDTE